MGYNERNNEIREAEMDCGATQTSIQRRVLKPARQHHQSSYLRILLVYNFASLSMFARYLRMLVWATIRALAFLR